MTSINPNQGVNTSYGYQPTAGVQPTSYAAGVNTNYATDQYKQTQMNQKPAGLAGIFGGEKKPYVTKQSVMTGLAGAGVGFMVGGPVGAIIGGVIGLLISVIMNIVNMKKSAANPIPAQPMQIYPNQQQMQGMNSKQQQEYMQRMQQQQQQQAYQQAQQNGQSGPQTYIK